MNKKPPHSNVEAFFIAVVSLALMEHFSQLVAP